MLDSGSGKKVPPRGRGACTARTRKVCFEKNTLSATLPSSYASRPRTWWSSTMWMAPDRWQATYTRIDAMEYRPKTAGPPPPPAVLQGVPGSGGRSPVRKGYPNPKASSRASRGTGAWHAARQAIQVHLSVHHPKRASSSSTSAQRPENMVVSPMQAIVGWVIGDRYKYRKRIHGAEG